MLYVVYKLLGNPLTVQSVRHLRCKKLKAYLPQKHIEHSRKSGQKLIVYMDVEHAKHFQLYRLMRF